MDDNDVDWVEGSGQWVYWKGCTITSYWKDDKGKERKMVHPEADGQGQVPNGTQLYCFGGKKVVKES